ncbi:MAG: nucleotide sugar dehydrogenase [Deltaproteobacteria bacterium]|nr:MAG: nucleotide sugar dehydrogenase [Deltaproteobacteria bacterium]
MSHGQLMERIENRTAQVGVIGLGYVGLPLATTFAQAGFSVLGFDIDPTKAAALSRGESYLKTVPSQRVAPLVTQGRLQATHDFSRAGSCDALLICVPTPLDAHREPDMRFIRETAETLAPCLRPAQLVVLESTTWPGTTEEFLRPILEAGSGLVAGGDFFLAYSPEREDPGNPSFETQRIPKLVGGLTEACTKAAVALYGAAMEQVVPVSTIRVAELAKLFENVFRAVNIALVNELKLLCHRAGIDVWEVIRAAATKPFGFMPFYPGPGLGGHCIPIDPFYLTWKAREYEMNTRFIELAGEINTSMPAYVVERVVSALNEDGKALKGARILVLGVAYKPNVDDMRESPAVRILERLQAGGAVVQYHDPHVPKIPPMRRHALDLESVPLSDRALSEADAVVVVTHHDAIDFERVAAHAALVVDTRGVVPSGRRARVVQA